jgi:ABC-type proline/glycine betaine transport system substrate-binding protein
VQRCQVANYRVAKKGFIQVEREEKRMMEKRQTETKRKKELNTVFWYSQLVAL